MYRNWIVAGIVAIASLVLGDVIGVASETQSAPAVRQDLLEFSDAFAEIAERLNPSVVNITVTERMESAGTREGLEGEEEDENDRYGFGSGVIVEPSGYIVTSNHVVEFASKVEVKLSDNRRFTAKIVGRDKETDLALIKVDSDQPLPAAPLGDSDKLRPGQWVMAIGNPFVYDHTVTVGVISALNRNLGTNVFDDFIQTDAAINFGNSGGPLLNVKGEVIGINTLISSQGTGIGFAIPINTAKAVLDQLKEKGRVSRGFLGLVPQQITAELQKALDIDSTQGVIVSSIQTGTPADVSGLRRYDVILEVDGKKIESEDQFRRVIAEIPPGNRIRLKVLRDKEEILIEPQLGERPESSARMAPAEEVPDKLGIKLSDMTVELRKEFGLDESVRGILVLSVTPGHFTDMAGLQRGDVIQEVNKKPVESAAAFEKQIHSARSGETFLLYVLRDAESIFLGLTVE